METDAMNHERTLVSGWRHGTVTLAEFAEKSIGLLEDLRRLHPAFTRLNAADTVRMRDLPVPADLSEFVAPLMDIAWDRQALYAFEPMNAEDESPRPESTNVDGYRIALYSAAPDYQSPRAVKVIVAAGVTSSPVPNGCTLTFGDIEPFTSTGFQRELLATVMAHWPVDTSTLSSFEFDQAVCGDAPVEYTNDRPDDLSIGWLTYVRRAGLIEALPPGTKAEPFGEPPGVLITLNGDRFEPGTPEQIAQARRIREALRVADLLGDPADTPRNEVDHKTIRPLRKNQRE